MSEVTPEQEAIIKEWHSLKAQADELARQAKEAGAAEGSAREKVLTILSDLEDKTAHVDDLLYRDASFDRPSVGYKDLLEHLKTKVSPQLRNIIANLQTEWTKVSRVKKIDISPAVKQEGVTRLGQAKWASIYRAMAKLDDAIAEMDRMAGVSKFGEVKKVGLHQRLVEGVVGSSFVGAIERVPVEDLLTEDPRLKEGAADFVTPEDSLRADIGTEKEEGAASQDDLWAILTTIFQTGKKLSELGEQAIRNHFVIGTAGEDEARLLQDLLSHIRDVQEVLTKASGDLEGYAGLSE